MAVWLPVLCPDCGAIIWSSTLDWSQALQRYLCQNPECLRRTFVLNTEHPGRRRETKQKIMEMALDGSKVRDPARVLQVSPATVIKELKKVDTPRIGESAVVANNATRASGSRNPVGWGRSLARHWRIRAFWKCGVMLLTKQTSAGSGMRLTARQERF